MISITHVSDIIAQNHTILGMISLIMIDGFNLSLPSQEGELGTGEERIEYLDSLRPARLW